MDKLLKPIGLLIVIILVCSVIVRVVSGSETLKDYAVKNPETALAAPTKQPSPSPEETALPMASPFASPSPLSSPSPAPADTSAPGSLLAEESGDSTHYEEGFFYQPLTDPVIARITGISYPVPESIASTLSGNVINIMADSEAPAVSYDDLCYMNVLYYDFNGEIQTGELICNKGIAQDLVEIFYELYLNEYQIEKIRLIDEYDGDDTSSMLDNNTSCFNYRVVDGTSSLSKHALGCAIDINPFYNPYVVFPKDGSEETYISPPGSEVYADRSLSFPYKIDENDLCYRLFKAHGFTWGGNWNSMKDYQHFQKVVN